MAAIDRSDEELDEGMEIDEGAEGIYKSIVVLIFGELIRTGDTLKTRRASDLIRVV